MKYLNFVLAFLFTFLSISLYPRESTLQMSRKVATNSELSQEVHDERSGATGVIDEENTFYNIKDKHTVEDLLELAQHATACFMHILRNYLNALKAGNEKNAVHNLENFKIQVHMYEELSKQLQDRILNSTNIDTVPLEHVKPVMQQQLHDIIREFTQASPYAFSLLTKVMITLGAPYLFGIIFSFIGREILPGPLMYFDYKNAANNYPNDRCLYAVLVFIEVCLSVLGDHYGFWIGFGAGILAGIISWLLPNAKDVLNPETNKERLVELEKIIGALDNSEKRLALATEIKLKQNELAKI
jgi:hypothetical protein